MLIHKNLWVWFAFMDSSSLKTRNRKESLEIINCTEYHYGSILWKSLRIFTRRNCSRHRPLVRDPLIPWDWRVVVCLASSGCDGGRCVCGYRQTSQMCCERIQIIGMPRRDSVVLIVCRFLWFFWLPSSRGWVLWADGLSWCITRRSQRIELTTTTRQYSPTRRFWINSRYR